MGLKMKMVHGLGGMERSSAPPISLAIDGELRTAILLPARLARFGAELLFFPVTDDSDAVGGYARVDECGAGGVGAVFAKREVVFRGAAFVGVAGHEDANLRMRG